MKKLLIVGLLVLFFQSRILGQSPNVGLKEPVVGRPCPEFVLNKIDFYKSSSLRLSDLKGKWVVLDFWGIGCSACISSFPKVSKMQRKFRDSVQFVMIGPDERPADRKVYANFHEKLKLSMPSAFDNALETSFNVGLLPHTIIIDPNGIVRAVTVSPDEEKLRELMSGDNPVFRVPSFGDDRNRKNRYSYSIDKPFLVSGNGGPDSSFSFRSLLAQWRPGYPYYSCSSPSFAYLAKNGGNRYDLIYVGLDNLYRVAYTGNTQIQMRDTNLYSTFYPVPVFEIDDKSVLKKDFASGKNVYCYSMTVPKEKATPTFMMRVMQNDLKNYFGYDVRIETRVMPCWRLTATKDARLKLATRGGPTSAVAPEGKQWSEVHFKNVGMDRLMTVIEGYSDVTANGSPLFDETGIKTNIDIDLMDFMKGDLDFVRKSLQKNGLDLVHGTKEMKVIVVRDSKPENQ